MYGLRIILGWREEIKDSQDRREATAKIKEMMKCMSEVCKLCSDIEEKFGYHLWQPGDLAIITGGIDDAESSIGKEELDKCIRAPGLEQLRKIEIEPKVLELDFHWFIQSTN